MTAAPSPAHRPYGPLSPFGLAIAAATLVVDQLTKLWAEAALPYGEPIPALPLIAFYRTYNSGVAFSFLRDFGSLSLILVTGVILGVVLLMWSRSEERGRLLAAGFALIAGGAIGNLVDRLMHGHVVDFLLLHAFGWSFFVFNLADAALTAGPVILVLLYFFQPQHE